VPQSGRAVAEFGLPVIALLPKVRAPSAFGLRGDSNLERQGMTGATAASGNKASDRKLIFILGGARSGKSSHAENLTIAHPLPWTYIATAQAYDDEMRERIALHQSRRGEGWVTVDAPLDLAGAIEALPDHQAVLIDCLTLWLTNHMLAEHDVEAECRRLADVLSRPRGPWFVVSNEVGLGIVPDNALARRFRDAAGRLNQQVAAIADSVLLMVAGLPLKVK
jgi:adenosylcobinamide kinase/adenosylcobinamide-phosphate guanylyltransferase